ncbi:protein STPG3 isoform X2 [Numida meleagris]|uniref:protein STPG3 isoform X2 n=1 Tax=Numida meleagris TaxID=8996 RepID=UPI000B3D8BBC|nr:protein STPG3 isoform X2 [Numida meleagris]
MGAGRCGGTKPWWLSAGLVTRKMELQRGADPTCSICCPQFTGAMYPHFIRQQRTSLDILRNRKHSGTATQKQSRHKALSQKQPAVELCANRNTRTRSI